jgi:hypothetical protein
VSNEGENAVIELHRYLSGLTPPLRAGELFSTLVGLPPERIVGEIQAWVRDQRQANPATPASEFVFHAIRRLYLIGEIGIVDPERVDAFFDWLLPLAVESSPHDERPHLRGRIAAMTHRVSVVPTFSGNVAVPSIPAYPIVAIPVEMPTPSALPPVAPETPPASASEQFELIVSRIAKEQAARRVIGQEEALAALAQLVILAASTAGTKDILRDMMRRIPTLVDPKQLGNVFQLMARSIPPWEIVLASQDKIYVPSAIPAMHKIISLSSDELERAKRLRELILAAIEQFNTGSLFAASAMLDLASTVMTEPGLFSNVADRIRSEAAATIDPNQLRNYVGEPARHTLLRKILGFFPSLSSEAMLSDLRGEPRQDRRRTLLALLQAWGPAGRDAALRRLKEELEQGPGADTWFLRNTIFLLHRIPREDESSTEEELEVLRQASSRDQMIYVAKEAIVAIATIHSTQAGRLLNERLTELENAVLRGDESRGPLEESLRTIDRIIAGLAKLGSPEALRRVVMHGLRTEPMLGDTRGRLAGLAQTDLSSASEALDRLIAAIRAELPSVLGRVIGKAANTTPLLQALSSTDTPSVRELLEEIAVRYQRLELGPLATATLSQLETVRARLAAASAKTGQMGRESGELRPFGLPELVQSLGESKASGLLTIAEADRRPRGRVVFYAGHVLDAESSALKDDEAFFNLIEHPEAGYFTFAPLEVRDGSLRAEITPLLVEGLSRHDSLIRYRVLVPDGAAFRHKGPRPTPLGDEKDPALMKEVWRRTISGAAVASWEGQLPADSFRIRRLVVHWLEEGAIEDTRVRT